MMVVQVTTHGTAATLVQGGGARAAAAAGGGALSQIVTHQAHLETDP